MAGKTEKTVAIKVGKGRVAGVGCFSWQIPQTVARGTFGGAENFDHITPKQI